MLVILKIPVVYLCLVVWWAIRSEPRPPEPAMRRLGPSGTSAGLAVLAGTAAEVGSWTARLPSRGYRRKVARVEAPR